MDHPPPRRQPTRSTVDPKIRQIGFPFTPTLPHSSSETPAISGTGTGTGAGDFSSPPPPVMIPPPLPDSSPVPVPVVSVTRRPIPFENYDPGDSVLDSSSPTSSTQFGDAELTDEWMRSSSGKYSLAFDMSGVSSPVAAHGEEELEVCAADENGAKMSEAQMSHEDVKPLPVSKPLKEKTSKAERRALQEAQRAAKAAQKAEASGLVARGSENPSKLSKQPPQKKDAPLATYSTAVSEMKGVDRSSEKDKKKDKPPPRMQYDDKNRVEKAKKRSVVKKTEATNMVELFRHLPQYEYGNQLSKLEAKFFELDAVHPDVYKAGSQYLTGDIDGSNARCIVMLHAFKEAIKDYHTPPEKILTRDLTAKISSYTSFLNECRPLSISMGNAIRFIKTRIAKLPLNLSESEAKTALCSEIDRFINEKIIIAGQVIMEHAATKIRDCDVLLTYCHSSVVEMILVYAHELGKKFRVVIVDSRPKFEGQVMLRRLVAKGLRCTYTHINAVSYVMHEVTRVLLGAASILCNGTVYSRIGTASVAMVAHEFRAPVLVCCESYKFHERVQLDSICANELGDPDAISKVPGRKDVNYLNNWISKQNLQLLNLLYDATPSDYVSLIVTDYGMVPPTSVPVIVRQYRKEHLF